MTELPQGVRVKWEFSYANLWWEKAKTFLNKHLPKTLFKKKKQKKKKKKNKKTNPKINIKIK